MTIKIMDLDGNKVRTFDKATRYDFTNYPIIELSSEEYKTKVVMRVPDSCYVAISPDEKRR